MGPRCPFANTPKEVSTSRHCVPLGIDASAILSPWRPRIESIETETMAPAPGARLIIHRAFISAITGVSSACS